jgi:hypothetical protein
MVKRVIVNILITKYKKTISVRVNPLGTIANIINTNQANKARTATDMVSFLEQSWQIHISFPKFITIFTLCYPQNKWVLILLSGMAPVYGGRNRRLL